MKKQHNASSAWRRWLRVGASWLCIILAAAALVGSVMARYVRDNVLDTDRYLEIISSLPADPKVSKALGQFTADRLFDQTEAQDRLQEFLPPKLEVLAPPLVESLKERVAETASKLVASDLFVQSWTATNRATHQALMRVAHSEPQTDQAAMPATTTLRLGDLLTGARERFGGDGAVLGDPQKDRLAEIRVDLQQSVNQLRSSVSIIETAATVLPIVFLVLVGLAIFAANNRRKAVGAVGVVLVVLASCMLLVFRLGSEHFLANIEQSVYRDAAATVYEAFYGNMRARLITMMVVGILVWALSLVFGPYGWAVRFREMLHIQKSARYHHRSTHH